jgi:hypothetical protein
VAFNCCIREWLTDAQPPGSLKLIGIAIPLIDLDLRRCQERNGPQR